MKRRVNSISIEPSVSWWWMRCDQQPQVPATFISLPWGTASLHYELEWMLSTSSCFFEGIFITNTGKGTEMPTVSESTHHRLTHSRPLVLNRLLFLTGHLESLALNTVAQTGDHLLKPQWHFQLTIEDLMLVFRPCNTDLPWQSKVFLHSCWCCF